MSDDSSRLPEEVTANRPLGGLKASILSTLSVAIIYFVLPILAVLIVAIYPHLQGWSGARAENWLTNSVPAQFWYVLLSEVFTVAAVLFLVRRFHWRLADIGLKKPQWHQPFIGLLAAVPYYAIYILMVLAVSALVPGFNAQQSQDVGFSAVHGSLDLILTFISLVILPPLAEEITMRGFLFTGLRKSLSVVPAALVVSLLFGAAHLAEGGAAGPLWVGALDTFILSLVLVFLRQKTGNLWAGITLHGFKNLVAFISLYVVLGR